LGASREASLALPGAVGAATDAQRRCQRALALACEDLDDAADGVRAVQARARTAHDLDPIDLIDWQVLKRRRARRYPADAETVDEHQRLVGLGAAYENRADLAEPAGIGYLDTRKAIEQVLNRTRLQALDIIARDHGDRGQRLVDRFRHTCSRYD